MGEAAQRVKILTTAKWGELSSASGTHRVRTLSSSPFISIYMWRARAYGQIS